MFEIKENLTQREKALLISVNLPSQKFTSTRKEELEQLVKSSGCEIVDSLSIKLHKINPSLYIGEGKTQEIASLCSEYNVDVVVFNCDLSSTQHRNLEEKLGCKVIDRTQLILDIFAQHASSPEGKLQVELAQLKYLSTRLRGKGIMLSRLGGGIGTRGPGEKKLEIDRRRIEERIHYLSCQINNIRKRREILRQRRKKTQLPVISLIGYTNAGKSTLLNTLTGSNQKVENSLFTTLDPVGRLLVLPNNQKVILADTVGFIENLPSMLIEAFMATLEEINQSQLIIHIIDIADRDWKRKYSSVIDILKKLKVEDIPRIVCFNKIDLLNQKPCVSLEDEVFSKVFISAKNFININELIYKIQLFFEKDFKRIKIFIPHQNFKILDFIYKNCEVLNSSYTPQGIILDIQAQISIIKKIENLKEIKIL